MIDWIKSAELNNRTVDELKVRFEVHPKSHKKVWRICEGCGDERPVKFMDRYKLCLSCAVLRRWEDKTGRDKFENAATKRWSDPSERDAQSDRLKEYNEDPEVRGIRSTKLKNSDAMKIAIENQIGGNDIVKHHYIYDHSDLSKYTMKVIRSKHMKIHVWMKKTGIIVPHINITKE